MGIAPSAFAAGKAPDCHIGTYRLDDRSIVDIGPSDDDTLRWRRLDGTTGQIARETGDRWQSTLGWTGKLDGYLLLAEDAIAAMHEARRLVGSRAGRIGYQVGSQGG